MVLTADERAGTIEPGDAPTDELIHGVDVDDEECLPPEEHLHQLWQVLGLDDEDEEE